ncbi:MAG: electron transport complex subunit RsxE [Actinobacteria bacterium]|nr:MAG: electron transport complex subunit RsxE [Actinomycetota bacterium]
MAKALAKEYELGKDFSVGLWSENPIFRQILGMCPTLAVTTSVINGFSMGMATLFVLFMASTTVAAIKKLVPYQVRLAGYVVIIASYVTIADLYLKGSFPAISKALGPYVPLIVVNCLILARSESFAAHHPMHRSMADAAGMGIGFAWGLVLLGGIRELFGNGSLIDYKIFGANYEPMVIMILPAGAFITLGIVLGLINQFSGKEKMVKETSCH